MHNYCVYKHTSPSGKIYIGITDNYQRRSNQHQWMAARGEGFAFHAAIRKYGWKNFKHEIVDDNLTKQQAEHLEIILIKELNTYAPNGYNLTVGGEGIDSESTRRGMIANRADTVKGYTWDNTHQKYCVRLRYLGRTLHFGCYKNESDAKARADYLMTLSDDELVKAAEEYSAGQNKGYTYHKKSNRYRVILTVDGKQKHFGSYSTEQEAINRVKEVRSEINRITNPAS